MKGKGFFKFIFIFAIILFAYFEVVLNIDFFSISYDKKMQYYDNPYYVNKNKATIFQILRKLNSESIEKGTNSEISEQELDTIINSKIIMNLLIQFCGVEDIDDVYILKRKNYIRKLVDDTYGEFIYITRYCEIAFTLDLKNIIYQDDNVYDYIINSDYTETTIDYKDDMYKLAKETVDTLGVSEKFNFEPESISIQSISDYGEEVCEIQDNVNKIKLQYEISSKVLTGLQIGFDFIDINVPYENLTESLQESG